jgi:hypothetical protein
MMDLISPTRRAATRLAGIALVVSTFALAACSGTTYGTGTSPGVQTVQDLAGIALLNGPKKDPIDYQPRPKVVLPPSASQLPDPAAENSASATPPNWPVDPDLAAAKIKADAAARDAKGEPLPTLKLPASALASPDDNSANTLPAVRTSRSGLAPPPTTAEDSAKAKKLFADARSNSLGVDANGNPVRRYLTDPPVDYRLADPNAPVAFDASVKKKKFHWFWQKDDDNN